ncbi:MAG: hypothetical protein ABI797_00255 [Chloroflexota bacterium]
MTVESEVGWRGWRAVPWSVWLFLALAVLYAVIRILDAPVLQPLPTAAGLAPFLFAAAVSFARPADRRFRWAAWAIAAYVALPLITRPIPELVFRLAPGDWSNAAFILQDVANVVQSLANALLIVGLALFGLALGGVRSAFGGAILAAGAAVALANLTWFFSHPIAEIPLINIAESVTFSTLTSLAWAFVFAAAIDAVRSLLIVGTGLLFANVVVNAVLLWWTLGPGTNTDVLSLVIGGMALAGWLALAAGALRGELTGPENFRSRAGRRSALRPGAG